MSVLAHDLRNPLATARMSSEILLKLSKNDIFQRHSRIIKSSTYRMESMIQNILDFARCQMHLGLELQKEEKAQDLKKVLQQVIKELKIISPERRVKLNASLETPVTCDPGRIGQLLSNLIGYAEAESIPETLFRIELFSKDGKFTLGLFYTGNEIPESAIPSLFDPFSQEDESLKKGVGLGLYIASEIAKAHGGTIEVSSTKRKTSFIFRMNGE